MVRARALARAFRGRAVLGPLDLELRAGEFVTLVGPSGCGKSTLLRMVAGLVEPTAGTLERDTAAHRQAVVFQSPTLMPWATVEDNVRLVLDLEGVPRTASVPAVRQALDQVGLGEFARAYPRELSGGMQMRASIARALVTRPQLLLMDEPFGALDEFTRARLDRDLLDLWQAQGLSVLFVTHSIAEAVYLSTRVVVLSARPGRVLEVVPVDEPFPRDATFFHSERHALLCARLSRLLVAGAGA